MYVRAVIDRGREAESEKSDTGAWSTSADRNGIVRWERSGVKEKNGEQRNSPPTDTLVSRFSCYISDINTAKGMVPLPVLRSTTILSSSGGANGKRANVPSLSRNMGSQGMCSWLCLALCSTQQAAYTRGASWLPNDSSSPRLTVPESTRARRAGWREIRGCNYFTPRSSGSLLLSYI